MKKIYEKQQFFEDGAISIVIVLSWKVQAMSYFCLTVIEITIELHYLLINNSDIFFHVRNMEKFQR